MRATLVLIASAGAALGTVPADAQDINAVTRRTAVVSNFDLPAIVSILSELKIAHRVADGSNGRYVNVSFANGIRATIGRSACRNNLQFCKGMTIYARFGRGRPEWTELEKLQRVNVFNYRHSFIKTGLDANGQFYLSRYELNDFGVSRGSIATSLLVYANFGEKFAAYLKAPLSSGALPLPVPRP